MVGEAHLDTYSERGQRGRVFVGEKGATMRRGNFQAMWAKAIKAAELPKGFHFHDLRHTGNTWAADSGASLRDLMDRMGHSSMRAALIYMHASKGASKAIARGIDRQLSAAAKKPKCRGRGRAIWHVDGTGARTAVSGSLGRASDVPPDQGRGHNERVTGIEPA